MPRLPPLSGRELVRALERIGFEQAGQRGSHLKLRRDEAVCIVPLHGELKKWVERDRCLDAGGRWLKADRRCEGERAGE